MTYTIVAVNGGSQAAPGVHVNVTLPSNAAATFVSADGSNGFNCAAPVGTLVDCVGDLPAGGNTVITIKLIVVLAPPGDLVLTAIIDPADAFDETNEGNNTQTETTTVSGSVCSACVDLVSVLINATPEPVPSGGSVTFTYILVNAGDMPTDFLPAQQIAFFDFFGTHTGFSITTSDPTAVSCTTIPSSGTSRLNNCVGNLGAGQGVTITATLTASRQKCSPPPRPTPAESSRSSRKTTTSSPRRWTSSSERRTTMKRTLFNVLAAAFLAAAGLTLGAGGSVAEAQDCARRYISTGDDIPFGHDVEETERFPSHLLEDHLKKWGPWCNYNIAQNGTTSSTEISQGQLAQTWNLRPDLITLTVGEQNTRSST